MINKKGEETGIIYGWYCIPTEKYYVGQTIDEEGRFKRHIKDAINKKDNTHFHRAIRKYGIENFIYCVLEDNVLIDNLNMEEQKWIEYYDSYYNGYNMTLGGGGVKGVIISEETRIKISESLKGKPAWNSGKTNVYSEETLNKMSKSRKGRKPWNKGIPMTMEQKIKISQSKTNPSEETRRKMSESHKGQISQNRRPVSQYDLNGNFIKTYLSISEAIKQNSKCTALAAVCMGKLKQAGGFIWKYA